MKRVFLLCAILILGIAHTAPAVQAGETDILIKKLVEKGILTPLEGKIIAEETKVEVERQTSQGKNNALPTWIQHVKLKGDLRLRYQNNKDEGSSNDERNRFRIRYRLGVIAKVDDEWEIGAGFASGGSDPRSTNQTLQDTFSTKAINLDYAYAKYQPASWFNGVAGKFKRKAYLWNPTDLLWDGDINPEGVSVHADLGGPGDIDTFINGGVWILDEYSSDKNDPYMGYVQGGATWTSDMIDTKVAATGYVFENTDAQLDNNTGTNTLNGNGIYEHDYNAWALSGEIGLSRTEEMVLPFERISLFGDYINNPDPDTNGEGYAVGVKVGANKIKKPGHWQAKYIYAELERDAWLDTFPDSDRFGGRTDVKAHEFAISYALKKNVIVGLDYYDSERISNSSDTEKILQADLLLKF